ncbi:hypothetical protein B0H16DRAFT_1466867 [Mycena metata]|uniref:Uncharacterized protein n=1 Tax=Mycena metata TaxID=1033252 RepID=A0AAD7MWV3_9AGAR|nr:hypothetical protein B0H16DRAFT_1466867 [Mycena metata]
MPSVVASIPLRQHPKFTSALQTSKYLNTLQIKPSKSDSRPEPATTFRGDFKIYSDRVFVPAPNASVAPQPTSTSCPAAQARRPVTAQVVPYTARAQASLECTMFALRPTYPICAAAGTSNPQLLRATRRLLSCTANATRGYQPLAGSYQEPYKGGLAYQATLSTETL